MQPGRGISAPWGLPHALGFVGEMQEERPETWTVPSPALQLGKEDVGKAPSTAEAREASWGTSSRHVMGQKGADGWVFMGSGRRNLGAFGKKF